MFKALLSKLPGQEAALTGGTTVADIRIGANPNPTPGGGLVDLKFTLRNLDDNDRQRYLCLLYYRKGNADKLLASGGLNLNLLGKISAFFVNSLLPVIRLINRQFFVYKKLRSIMKTSLLLFVI